MSKANQIRILIADNHPVVREGLVAMINRRPDMTVVAEAQNGREAVELFCQHYPDVALVDLRMPEMDGVETIVAIQAQCRTARIIVLTTYDGDEDIYRGLRAGAKAYVLKDAPREELLECIRAVHDGRTFLSLPVAAKLAEYVRSAALTSREQETLHFVAKGKSNREIASALSITEGTVKIHVNNILSKLGVSSRTEAVAVALRRGLVHLE